MKLFIKNMHMKKSSANVGDFVHASMSLKIESRYHANFVITGGTAGCHTDNLRRHQWRQSFTSWLCFLVASQHPPVTALATHRRRSVEAFSTRPGGTRATNGRFPAPLGCYLGSCSPGCSENKNKRWNSLPHHYNAHIIHGRTYHK